MKYPTLILSLSTLLLAEPIFSQEKTPEKFQQSSAISSKQKVAKTPTEEIKNGKLDFKVEFEAVLLPKAVKGLIHLPEAWSSYPVLEALPHGSPVNKGESVIKVDTEGLENAIIDQTAAVASVELSLQEAKTSLERLKRDQQLARERSERSLNRLLADHKRYLEITVPTEKSDAAFNMSQRERRLEGEKEELRQLTAMYQEDELTEETEEIILKRARDSVADAEYLLKKAKVSTEKELEIDQPRAIENFQLTVDQAKREAADREEDRKVALMRKEMALDSAQLAYDRAVEKLAGLKNDLELSKFPADKDGHVFYGIVEAGGKWNFGETSKRLVRGGSLAPRQPLFTIVPQGAELMLSAIVNAEQVEQLAFAKSGYASVADSPYLKTKVTLNPIPEQPLMNGQYRITLEVDPAKFLSAGNKVKVTLLGSSDKEGPIVARSAVKTEDDGSFSVMIQTDKEKFEKRSVVPELANKDSMMISKGLKAGDTVKKSIK